MNPKYMLITRSFATMLLLLVSAYISGTPSNAEALQSDIGGLAKEHNLIHSASIEGYAWLPLGDGTDDWVFSLATDKQGNLYAGGSFTKAGGVNAQVAKWNGISWSALGTIMDGYIVEDLTVDSNGNLYAAFFSNTGGKLSSHVSRWNGSNWLLLGATNDGIVYDLATDKAGNLFVAGEFSQLGGTSASNIAMWNGSNWLALGSGTNSSVYAVDVDLNGDIYAGGSFSQAGGKPANMLAKWDGDIWSTLGSEPGFGYVNDLKVDEFGKLYVSYYVGIYMWSDNTWQTLDSISSPTALAFDENGNLYASFYDFTIDGAGSVYSVRKWQGNDWDMLGYILGGLIDIDYQGYRLYVSGAFSSIEGVSANNIAMFVRNSFSDVDLDHWAQIYIERLYIAGITGGCSTNPLSYCPDTPVTRAQMAVFLEKGVHFPSAYSPPKIALTFTDTVGHWAEDWIEALRIDGITGGCGVNLYCPESPVTRAQMAVFLLKSKYGSSYTPPPVGASTGFTDVPISHWAAPWIKQLAAEGITGGCGTGIYCPESPVTRAQMAVFLVRTFNLP